MFRGHDHARTGALRRIGSRVVGSPLVAGYPRVVLDLPEDPRRMRMIGEAEVAEEGPRDARELA